MTGRLSAAKPSRGSCAGSACTHTTLRRRCRLSSSISARRWLRFWRASAKAMVVVASRLEAVRWQLAINKYIKDRGYEIATLVAFSGEISDSESGPDPFTETSRTLNPNLRGRDMREAFNTDEYQILLVANKFQTGFDQPLLCGMYVDKRLAGIAAVQTLTRLNRAHDGKDTTYIVDFVNDPGEILSAFKMYYATAELASVTDPHLVYDLRDEAGRGRVL